LKSSSGFLASIGYYTAANALNAAVPFLLIPVMTRVLSPTDYGIIAMFGVVLSVAGAFTGLSVHGAVGVRYFQFERRRLPVYVGACLAILAVSTAVALIVVAAARPWLERLTHIPGDWLLVAVLVSGAQFVVNIRLSLWQVQGRALRYGVLQVSQSLVNACLSLVLILGLGMAWEGRTVGQAAAIGSAMIAALISLLLAKEVARGWKTDDVRDALRFGVPLIPHILGGVLIATADRFMIANMLDLAEAGIYMVALQIGMILGLFTESFNKAYAPWLMAALANPESATTRKIVRGTYLYFVGMALASVALGLAAPALLSVLVGEEFRGSAGAVIYVAMGFAFGGMYYMVANYIFFANKTSYLAAVTFVTGSFHVIATWYLIKSNGTLGAAQAFMMSQAVMFLGTWWLAHRAHPMPWRKALLPMA
jgi:O-antigen/teichoic acid export membrane protein